MNVQVRIGNKNITLVDVCSWEQIVGAVANYGLLPPYFGKYTDDEGDLVTVASEEEFQEALRLFKNSSTFQLEIFGKKRDRQSAEQAIDASTNTIDNRGPSHVIATAEEEIENQLKKLLITMQPEESSESSELEEEEEETEDYYYRKAAALDEKAFALYNQANELEEKLKEYTEQVKKKALELRETAQVKNFNLCKDIDLLI
jgi:hypothetical protein